MAIPTVDYRASVDIYFKQTTCTVHTVCDLYREHITATWHNAEYINLDKPLIIV